ncbi:MAG: DNA (cytosine-5-)-methyltransferase [Magnetococcales bacterium]|nr:DNA (cytosine-5-)-methyltransferase [Magnetococcales bacterium]
MPTQRFVYGNRSRMEYDISEARREEYRRSSEESREARRLALEGKGPIPIHPVNHPNLDPNSLMPIIDRHHLRSLSLFSGGGGLDLAFDRAGFLHVASFDIIPICGSTITLNRPEWEVCSGPAYGDVRKVDWSSYSGKIDVIHGGPPCQPFSIAGQQKGKLDDRNMWSEFIRAIHGINPICFVGENVTGILDSKFSQFVESEILFPLRHYHIHMFELSAPDFGVPQARTRVFFVGFANKDHYNRFKKPTPTHRWKNIKVNRAECCNQLDLFEDDNDILPETMGVRKALGLPNIGFDGLAPTLRSGFTGKRNTTSVLNSKASEKAWEELGIWGSGVQANREAAHRFVANNGTFRLSVQDCGLIQGFPEEWAFSGAVYQIIGQIGNSVAPPVGYAIARAVVASIL